MRTKKFLSLLLSAAMAFSLLTATAFAAAPAEEENSFFDFLLGKKYTYLYAALTWDEYWANEKVYAAGSTAASAQLDSHEEQDLGAFDAVSRATVNQIITDSTIDMDHKMIEELGLTVVPLRFTIDGKTYKDKADLSDMPTETFYAKLREGKMSTTSQINADEFTRVFEPVLQGGEDVLYIAFSSGLSGTCQSAFIARDELKEKYPERKIYVFDSLCASLGEGLLVYHAAMLKRAGTDIDSLYKWLGENVLKLCHWFTVDDLNHLKRGGRVSATAALVGTLLGVKPVLHVDDEGHLIPVSKVRGRRQSLDALVQKMEETAIQPADQTVFISHGDCLADAEYVANRVREKFGVKNIYINFVGPVIGAHSGPGTVALFFIGEHR